MIWRIGAGIIRRSWRHWKIIIGESLSQFAHSSHPVQNVRLKTLKQLIWKQFLPVCGMSFYTLLGSAITTKATTK